MMRALLTTVLAAALTATAPTISAPAVAAPATAAPRLPAPTGPHPVGTLTRELVDASRADPWVPSERRRLMVTLWYPAAAPSGDRARYVTPEESALLLAAQGLPAGDLLSRVRTHSFAAAPPVRGRLPLVILSPGFGLPRSSLTLLGEDLASHGYAVAAVDHTYESAAITFPGGRTTTCRACEIEDAPGLVPAVRSADVSFVVDRLLAERPALIDPARIGMAGHSIGGNSAARAMEDDTRIDAGADMDGAFIVPPPAGGLARPFLLLGTPDVPTWAENWPLLTGWRRWAEVAGAEHDSFTDYPVLGEQLGLPAGTLRGTRAAAITRAYLRAFFDVHLRGRSGALLNGPSPAYPEVTFRG
ncbi:alpha/beta hydrolase family protein [Nonomuraea pusilla]|uniref:Alpha/beta hydrolase family protein n=1 Tax=Nonomuraea pusilla TaxID=46177 RepID=A0A1H8CHA1_9ACTN|nr:alpha/beta hydrolase [Nonomuraea pusilla]SEM94332.1 Alpha/beta hydrolase family protein [Nonomuraea pusilla]